MSNATMVNNYASALRKKYVGHIGFGLYVCACVPLSDQKYFKSRCCKVHVRIPKKIADMCLVLLLE